MATQASELLKSVRTPTYRHKIVPAQKGKGSYKRKQKNKKSEGEQ